MLRKLSMLAALIVVGLAALALTETGQAQEKKKGKGMKAPYVHTVIFYLKKDAPKDAVDHVIADAHELLTKIPSVKGLWVGRPAEKSTPKFSTKDYDVGLLVLFENYEGLQEYLDHKLHIEYVERHGKHFDRVSVFDFMNQKK